MASLMSVIDRADEAEANCHPLRNGILVGDYAVIRSFADAKTERLCSGHRVAGPAVNGDDMNIHPGEILLDFMDEYGLSQRRLADLLGVSPRAINEIVHGRRRVTAPMSLRLGKLFGQTDSYWTKLQAEYDLRAARAHVDVSAIQTLAV